MIKVRLKSGEIVQRRPKITPFGNFQMIEVNIDHAWRIVGDGDEYLRDGCDKVFELSPIYGR